MLSEKNEHTVMLLTKTPNDPAMWLTTPFSRYYSGYHLGGISFPPFVVMAILYWRKGAFHLVPQVKTTQGVIISLKHEHFTRQLRYIDATGQTTVTYLNIKFNA